MTQANADDESQGVRAGGRDLENKRGYDFPAYDWLAKQDPVFEEARQRLVSLVYTPVNPALPVKYRELIVAAILASRGYPTIDVHLRRALREGASMQEVIEAMETAAIPGGFPTLHFALTYLVKIAEDLQPPA
jgi:alkylhydroperoxidase/carboxymuconolactone decarboxylase family protein YurZ